MYKDYKKIRIHNMIFPFVYFKLLYFLNKMIVQIILMHYIFYTKIMASKVYVALKRHH